MTTMLTNYSVCPRCSNQVPGILVSEDSGYFVSCLLCGYVVRDEGFHRPSYKGLFARMPDYSEEIHHTERCQPTENDVGLSRISFALEKCCSRHPGGIPACSSCQHRYDRLATKSVVDGRIDKHDIETAFDFVREVLGENI